MGRWRRRHSTAHRLRLGGALSSVLLPVATGPFSQIRDLCAHGELTPCWGIIDHRYFALEELTHTWLIRMVDAIPEGDTLELAGLMVKELCAKFVATQTVAWRDPAYPLPSPDQNTAPIVGLLIPHSKAHEPQRRQPMLIRLHTTPDHYRIFWVGRSTGMRPPIAEGLPACSD